MLLMGGTFDDMRRWCGAFAEYAGSSGFVGRVGESLGVFSGCTLLGFEGPGPAVRGAWIRVSGVRVLGVGWSSGCRASDVLSVFGGLTVR